MKHELIKLSPAEVISAFHRGQNALVNIEGPHGEAGAWHVLASMTGPELLSNPKMAGWLTGEQTYFGLASVYRSRASFASTVTGLNCRLRNNGLQYLNAVAVDVDQHDGQPFDFDTAVQAALDYTIQRGLPFPSLVSSTGRGLWLFWLLRDRPAWNDRQGRAADHPPGAHSNLQGLLSRINRAAVEAYRGLRQGTADSACSDSQRVARFPGSVNAANGQRCEYSRVSDRLYTFPEIADAFGVKAIRTRLTLAEDSTVTPCTGKRDCKCSGQRFHSDTGRPLKPVCLTLRATAGRARWMRPFSAIQQLAEHRGTFSKGTRHDALYYLACMARRAGLNVASEVYKFAAKYCPTLTGSDIRKTLKAANKNTGKIRNAVIVERLKITDAELAQITGWIKPARAPKGTRKTAIESRREILAAELKKDPNCSIRRAVFLLVQAGLKIGRSQVAESLRVLRDSLVTSKERGRGLGAGAQTPPLHPAFAASPETQTRQNPVSLLICISEAEGQRKPYTGTSMKTGRRRSSATVAVNDR